MVDVYDRVTGRNDERKTLETRVAELGVEEAEQKSAGIDGDFKLRERVRMAKPLSGQRVLSFSTGGVSNMYKVSGFL